MNRAQLRQLIIEATGRTDKVPFINNVINIAVQEVSAQRNWSDLQVEGTVSASTGVVTLAADVARVSEVRVVDGGSSWPIEIRQKSWLVERYPNPDMLSRSRPVYGYLEGRKLVLIPVPDTTYEIRYTYYRLHPPLNEELDETLIRGADQAIVAYAVFWVFQSIEKPQEAVQWYQVYQSALATAKKVDTSNSVVKSQVDGWDRSPRSTVPYWLDPFAQRTP